MAIKLLVELLLRNIDEESIKAAHGRVTLLFRGGLARGILHDTLLVPVLLAL